MTERPADPFTQADALEACAREPIHVPGVAQAHGALLAIDPLSQRVTHASANFCEIVGLTRDFEPLGNTLDVCVGAVAAGRIYERLAYFDAESHLPVHECIALAGRRLDVLAHRHAGRTILEFTAAQNDDGGNVTLEHLQRMLNMLGADTEDRDLWTVAADLVRDLTGLHRVMIYRFDQDWNGEVVGESRRQDLAPFLGLNYPAGDIPVQARRLYEINLARYIPDVQYVPVALRVSGECVDAAPLDMSLADLRGISPVHIEYLQNMGVRATFVLSLMVNGRLWGMIACHHYQLATVPLARRKMVGIVAHSLATLIARSSARRVADATAQADLLQARMLAAASAEGLHDFDHLVGQFEKELRDRMQAGAILAWSDKGVSWWGEAAPEVRRAVLVEHLRQRVADTPVWQTSQLGDELPDEAVFGGALVVRFDAPGRAGMAMLRQSRDREVFWAGDPRKVVTLSADGLRLSPRRSFAAWREIVRGRSAPWSEIEQRFVADLSAVHVRFALRQARDTVHERTRALEATVRQLEEFDYTIAHDLRAPLRGLIGFATLLRTADAGDSAAERERYLERIIANAQFMNRLLDDLLAFARTSRTDVKFGPVSCNGIVAECLGVLGQSWPTARFEVADLPDCTGDGTLLKQVWLNLLDNAAKYSAGRETPVVRVDFDAGFYRVRDNGVGFDQKYVDKVFGVFTRLHSREEFEGSGIGMAVAKRVVERHGGVLEAEGRVGEGATFRFRL